MSDASPTVGALYFSAVLSTTFYGVACIQTFFYYTHYQDDAFRTKIFVSALLALNTVHEALIITGVYKCITTVLMTQGLYVDGVRELIMQVLFTNLVGLPTQGFFIYRIYIFSGKKIVIPVAWLILAVYQLVATLIYVVTATMSENGVVPIEQTFTLRSAFSMGIFVSSISVAAGADVLIAICMCILLVRERTRTPMLKNTALVLHRLTIFAVNSGVWTATFAVLSAVLRTYTFPSELISTVFVVPLCSVYCNTLLANLNVRAYIGTETVVMSSRELRDTEGNSQG